MRVSETLRFFPARDAKYAPYFQIPTEIRAGGLRAQIRQIRAQIRICLRNDESLMTQGGFIITWSARALANSPRISPGLASPPSLRWRIPRARRLVVRASTSGSKICPKVLTSSRRRTARERQQRCGRGDGHLSLSPPVRAWLEEHKAAYLAKFVRIWKLIWPNAHLGKCEYFTNSHFASLSTATGCARSRSSSCRRAPG